MGMIMVLIAGLYGVVCPFIFTTGSRAYLCKIYGPTEEPKESDSANLGSETSPLLQEDGETSRDYGENTEPEV